MPGRSQPGDGITVAGANTDGNEYAIDDLVAVSADVLVVSEVTRELNDMLAPRYPHHYAESLSGPEVAVYSRFPISAVTAAEPNLPGARVELTTPRGTVVVYALHVPRPWYTDSTGSLYQATIAEHRRLIAGSPGGSAPRQDQSWWSAT